MAYDKGLADRVDALLAGEAGYVSKRMFGGIAMMLGGNMAVGVISTGLLVRAAKGEQAGLMSEPGTRPFDMGRGPSKGWVVVVPEAVDDDEALETWVRRGVRVARALPPKEARERSR